MNNKTFDRTSLRLSTTLLLAGQLLYVVVTLVHTGGEANNHPAIFTAYAGSVSWTAVHLSQFASVAILLAGLVALFFALGAYDGTAKWASGHLAKDRSHQPVTRVSRMCSLREATEDTD